MIHQTSVRDFLDPMMTSHARFPPGGEARENELPALRVWTHGPGLLQGSCCDHLPWGLAASLCLLDCEPGGGGLAPSWEAHVPA